MKTVHPGKMTLTQNPNLDSGGFRLDSGKRYPHIPLDTTPRPAHNARVAATPATGFSRLNQRRASRLMTVFLCPKSAYASRHGVAAGEAFGLAGFVGRSANPCRHAAIWNSSQSAASQSNEVLS